MADRLRLINFDKGGRPVVIRDLNDGTIFDFIRGSLNFTAPQRTPIVSASERRYGGSRTVAETHANGTIEFETYIHAATPDLTLATMDAMVADLETPATDRYIEWRPEAASKSLYYPLRGPGPWDPMYNKREFDATGTAHLKMSVSTAPLPEGDRMDIWDPFDVDTITAGDYAFDLGTGTFSVSGGLLIPSTTAEKRLTHTARNYLLTDEQVTFQYTTGASVAGAVVLGRVAWLDSQNWLEAGFDAAIGKIGIWKMDVNVRTQLDAGVAVTLLPNTTYWVRIRKEGNLVFCEHYLSLAGGGSGPPTPVNTSTASTSFALTGANATKFGAGVSGRPGLRVIPSGTDWRFDDFKVEPFTYRSNQFPQRLLLPAIPGDAPAKVDVQVAGSSVAGRPWGVIGWTKAPQPFNYVRNGDFETWTTDGWSTAIVAGVVPVAATSITQAFVPKFGGASGQVQTPATSGSGVNYPIYRRFKKGIKYTVSAWLWSAAQTTNTEIGLGVSGDQAVIASALTATPQFYTTTWTPTADRDTAYVFAEILAATSTNFFIDGVTVYEGVVAPTVGRHAEGAGAPPPWGILEAENNNNIAGASLSPIVADAAMSNGFKIGGTATTLKGQFLVDPNLLAPDDFTLQELRVEVYGRLTIPTASGLTTVVLAAYPETAGIGVKPEESYGTGVTMIQPTSTLTALTRLGTLTFPLNASKAARWVVQLTLTSANSVAWALDYLLFLPARQMAAGPTGKKVDSTYPYFFNVAGPTGWGGTGDYAKIIQSDLSGLSTRLDTPASSGALTRDSGLGGQQIEFPPGIMEVVAGWSSVGVDDPLLMSGSDQIESPSIHFIVVPRYFASRGS